MFPELRGLLLGKNYSPLFIGSTIAKMQGVVVSVHWMGAVFCRRLLAGSLCLLCVCFWVPIGFRVARDFVALPRTPSLYIE